MKEDVLSSPAQGQIVGGEGVFQATQVAEHARCIVCGSENPSGLQLEFIAQEQGTVSASFPCHRSLQGYAGFLHGGIVSALLDGAMTNCLFSLGILAVTAELSVRYLAPVRVECPAAITATLVKSHGPLYCLSAELRQDGEVLARASGKFVDKRRARAPKRSGKMLSRQETDTSTEQTGGDHV